MKVIELLNKIANGEEVPKKVKYKNKIYEWKEYDTCYGKIWTKKGWKKEFGYVAEENRTYFYLKHCYQDLNDKVEIIEDEKIEKLNLDTDELRGKEIPRAIDYLLESKISEIIDILNEMREDKCNYGREKDQ